MNEQSGQLYVVATPIGNLADFTYRAAEILTTVDCIAAEDTRHIKKLLQHYAINKRLLSLHQHNEENATNGLVQLLQQGQSIALVSDAGTPLISDPGLLLVIKAQELGIRVTPIPGPCALITALSTAGLPLSRFVFEGFPPRTESTRRTFFTERRHASSTWVFYESSHRILACLEDMLAVFPADTCLVIARELTKVHETIVKDTLANIHARVRDDADMRKGEFVVIVAGAKQSRQIDAIDSETEKILAVLLTECSTKTAASLASQITGIGKKKLYQAALDILRRQSHKPV